MTDEDEAALREQVAYYRARAEEYDEWFLRLGRYDRGGQSAAADRPVLPGPVRRRAAARGKGGGVGWALMTVRRWRRDTADLPLVRASQFVRICLRRERHGPP